MKKRYKFRLQKNSIKDDKESNSSTNQSNTSKSPQNSSSPVPQANVSSPVSSMSSASSSSSPSSPSLTPSQSTPSPPGETNLNCNANHETNPKTNGYSSPINTPINISSSQPAPTTSNFNVITHLIKPIDRTFLETVHEEELPPSNSDESNRKSVINSMSVQSFESTSSSKEEKSNDETNQSKSQLYEQLSQLKPLKSQSFKSTTSICLNASVNGENTPLVHATENSTQNKVLTSSMTITPNLLKPVEVLSEKITTESTSSLSKIPIASATDSNSLFRSGQSVKFNDYSKSFPLRSGVLSKFSERRDLTEKPILTSSMELNCKQIDSNDLAQNGSLNDLAKANNSFKTTMQSSMIIPRRNSALMSSVSANLTSNNSRRVSVSDL